MSRNPRYRLLTLVKGLAALEAVDGGLTLTELARRLKESQRPAEEISAKVGHRA